MICSIIAKLRRKELREEPFRHRVTSKCVKVEDDNITGEYIIKRSNDAEIRRVVNEINEIIERRSHDMQESY